MGDSRTWYQSEPRNTPVLTPRACGRERAPEGRGDREALRFKTAAYVLAPNRAFDVSHDLSSQWSLEVCRRRSCQAFPKGGERWHTQSRNARSAQSVLSLLAAAQNCAHCLDN